MRPLPKKNESSLKERLELPRAIMLQLQETCLFNPLIERAIEDIDYLLTEGKSE